MITTVTLNAAIDKTYELSSFRLDRVNRTQSVWAEPGGKGINVAKVLQVLGAPVTASGIVGGFNGDQICSRLDGLGLRHDFVRIEEESRICLNLIDQRTGGQTEILESGPEIEEADWIHFQEKFEQLANKSDYMILSGSLPKGLPVEAYAELIERARPKTRVVLDTSGPPLEKSLHAKPFMIKPNEEELAALLHQECPDESFIVETLRQWEQHGIPIMIVSLGRRGAIASINGDIYRVEAPTVQAVNPVGSGDAFTAGMVTGLFKRMDAQDTLRLAAATGAANALEKRAGFISLKHIEVLKEQIKVERI